MSAHAVVITILALAAVIEPVLVLWVVFDARARGAPWWWWIVVLLLGPLGFILYLLKRPPSAAPRPARAPRRDQLTTGPMSMTERRRDSPRWPILIPAPLYTAAGAVLVLLGIFLSLYLLDRYNALNVYTSLAGSVVAIAVLFTPFHFFVKARCPQCGSAMKTETVDDRHYYVCPDCAHRLFIVSSN